MPSDQVEVTVYNACGVEGLAAAGVEKAKQLGFPNAETKNAATPMGESMVGYRSSAYEAAARELAEGFGIDTVFESGENAYNAWYYDGNIALVLSMDQALALGLIDEMPEDDSWADGNPRRQDA